MYKDTVASQAKILNWGKTDFDGVRQELSKSLIKNLKPRIEGTHVSVE